MRVYVSGPLQASTDLGAARALYEQIAAISGDAGFDAYVPHLHTDPEHAAGLSAEAVFAKDLAALLEADVIVAHVGAPSTGVGAELGIARNSAIHIIGIHRNGESVSRFAEGLITASGGQILTASSTDQLVSDLTDALRSIHKHLTAAAAS